MSNGCQSWHVAVRHLDPTVPVCPINVMSIRDRTGGLPPALSHCTALTRHMQMVQFPSDGVKTSPSVWTTPLLRQPASRESEQATGGHGNGGARAHLCSWDSSLQPGRAEGGSTV